MPKRASATVRHAAAIAVAWAAGAGVASSHGTDAAPEEVLVSERMPPREQDSDAALMLRLQDVAGGTNLVVPSTRPQMATLSDLLSPEPGIIVQEFFGGFDQPRLNIRGSGAQSNPVSRGVLLRQDYLPLNEADGSFIIGELQPNATRAMTVHRGANSRVVGSAALGGDINMISHTGRSGARDVRAELGQDGRSSAHANLGGFGDTADYQLSAGASSYDGFRHHSASERGSALANAGFTIDERWSNRSYLSYVRGDMELPFVLSKEQVKETPESVIGDGDSAFDQLLNIYQRDPRREFDTLRAANRTRFATDTAGVDLGVYWQSTDDHFVDPLSHAVTDTDTLGVQLTTDLRTAGDNRYEFGLSWDRSDMPRDYYVNNPDTGARAQQFAALDLEASNIALSALADYALGNDWRLSPQLQWISSTRDAADDVDGEARDQRWDYWLPKLGLIYQPSEQLRLFANVSASREAPTYWEIVQVTLPPFVPVPGLATVALNDMDEQRAVTLELGGNGQLGEHLDWDVTVYRSELDDEILSVASSFGVIAQSSNYPDSTVHQGVEAALHGALPAGPGTLSYRAVWTYSDFYFDGGEFEDNQIAGVPEQVLFGSLSYRLQDVTAGASVYSQPTGNQVDHANTLTQDAYWLLGLQFGWEPRERFRLYLNVNNLLDNNYEASYAVRDRSSAELPTFNPGNGRDIIGGFSYRW